MSRFLRYALCLLLAVCALFYVALQPIRSHLQALAVLHEVEGRPVPWIATGVIGPVTRQDLLIPVTVGSTTQEVRARLYRPSRAASAPAMVIFHGVHHLGIDEPRLMSFASAIASCGVQVLTPELPDIKDYRVSRESLQTIGGSVAWFATRTGGPVGVAGLSFSGGLALVAAADPRYHPAFKFIFAVGSQDSMARVIQYYRTGRDLRPDGTVEQLPPHEYGPLVIEYEHLEDFVPPQDLAPVQAVLRAHLYEDSADEKRASLALDPAQKRESLELMDATSAATHARIQTVAREHAAEMAALSPQGRLANLGIPVYLLHGQADNIIPSAETLWLARELHPHDLKAVLVSPILSHVNLDGAAPTAMDSWRLLHFFARVMQAADSR